MNISTFFKTLFGKSEEELELKRQANEIVQRRKESSISIAEARERLEQAHVKMHQRTAKIRERQSSQHDGLPVEGKPGAGRGN